MIERLEVPDPAKGYIDYSNWTCNNSAIIFVDKTSGTAHVKATKSFEGIAKVECLYVAKWYGSDGRTNQTTYLHTFNISCVTDPSSGPLEVSINPKSGSYKEGTLINLSVNNKKADIYYTTDGSEPSKNNYRYTGSLLLSRDMTVKAKAFLGNETSKTLTAEYTLDTSGRILIPTPEGHNLIAQKNTIKINNKKISVYEIGEGGYNTPAIDKNITGSITVPGEFDGKLVYCLNKYAFYNSSLSKITLSEGIEDIYGSAFELSDIDILELPSTISMLGSYCLYLCFLDEIYLKAAEPPTVSKNTFDDYHYRHTSLYVPVGSKQAYKKHNIWSKFNEIIECDYSSTDNNKTSILLSDKDSKGADSWYLDHGVLRQPVTKVWEWRNYNDFYYLNASAYVDGTPYSSDGWAFSPIIQLNNDAKSISFEHAAKYQTTLKEMCSINIRVQGDSQWTELDLLVWPTAGSWTFANSSEIDISKFAGKKVQFGIHYSSDSRGADTWEIRNMAVPGTVISNAPNDVKIIKIIEDWGIQAKPKYFDLQGIPVKHPKNGMFIKIQNGKASKVLLD